MRHFQKQTYEKAREFFEKLASVDPPEIASRARDYLRMCEQKLSVGGTPVKGTKEYYDLGVAQLNVRNLDAALESLSKAQKAGANQEHVRYALAAVYALQGKLDAALDHLEAAIQLRPANRFLAARDEDFQSLADHPRFRQLIRPPNA